MELRHRPPSHQPPGAPGCNETMSDQPDTPTSTGADETDETDAQTERTQWSEDTPTSDITEASDNLAALRDALEYGTADAMNRLDGEHGIDSVADLYGTLGMDGETVEVTIEIHETELYELTTLLEQATRGNTPAPSFVARANALTALINDAITPEMVAKWGRIEPIEVEAEGADE